MSSRPGRITIGAQTYHIKWSRKIGSDLGHSDPETNRIRVRTRKHSLGKQQSTLIHEYLHMSLAQAGGQAWKWMDEETEEQIVRALEDAVLQLFRPQNRPVRRWLTR